MAKIVPLNCCKCGRFLGENDYPDVTWDDYMGGWEEGSSYCCRCAPEYIRKARQSLHEVNDGE